MAAKATWKSNCRVTEGAGFAVSATTHVPSLHLNFWVVPSAFFTVTVSPSSNWSSPWAPEAPVTAIEHPFLAVPGFTGFACASPTATKVKAKPPTKAGEVIGIASSRARQTEARDFTWRLHAKMWAVRRSGNLFQYCPAVNYRT